MRIAPAVILNNKQRQTLEQWARGRSLPARWVERARIVLLAGAGKQDLEIAEELRISNQKAARSGTAQDGTPFTRGGFGSAILRKHSDGGWRVAVENPWGPAVLDVTRSN
jgi:hypothetical protein